MRSLFNAVRMFSISGTVVGALVLSAGPAHGDYPAAYSWLKTTRVDVSTCVNTARQALAAAGVSGITNSTNAAGGVTSTTRAFVDCVSLPHDGYCGGEGSTAVVIGAGADAYKVSKKVLDHFDPPVVIDCGIAGNPVDD